MIGTLEKAIKTVLDSKKATVSEKMQAINAGTKLLMVRNKINPEGDKDGGNFFGK